MDKLLEDTLKLLNLNNKEIKFFKTCFKLGNPTINEVIKVAKLERSTGYLIAQSLIEKDLIEEDYREYKKRLIAAEPKKLLRILSTKGRTLGRQEIELKEKLPELQAVYKVSDIRPNVRVFDGLNGLLEIWQDILTSKTKILLWSNQETEKQFFTTSQHQKFIEERIKKNIQIEVLAVNNEKGSQLKKNDGKAFRQTKLLQKGITFSAETYIYDNKVAILDYKKDIIGIIIESEPIYTSQKAIFQITWSTKL
jgi:HTH-type transcriptional regulator, sugar sensing transcriptional regulator